MMELWIKTARNTTIRAYHIYHPGFYAVHTAHRLWEKEGTLSENYEHLVQQFSSKEKNFSCAVVSRRYKAEHPSPSPVLEVRTNNPSEFKKIIAFNFPSVIDNS